MAVKKSKAKASASASFKKAKLSRPKNGVQYSQAEFYECMREVCGLDSRRVAKDVYGGFAGLITSALRKGYKVPLPGIGKILVRESKARMGRNPATGEVIRIPARKRVRLTASKSFKQSVL